MPITGTEAELQALLHDNILSYMQAAGVGADLKDAWLQAFCLAVSTSIIQHLVANVQVNTGQSVNVPGAGLIDSVTSAPITGDATGTVDTTGTIS
jgi:hypothetical protein